MKFYLWNVLALLIALVAVAGCGKNDDNILGTQVAGGAPAPGYWPYGPGNYLGQYCGAIPVTKVDYSLNVYYYQLFHGKPTIVSNSLASFCANAKIWLKGKANKDLFIQSTAWDPAITVTKAELAAGKTITFSSPGNLILGCESCNHLKFDIKEFGISY